MRFELSSSSRQQRHTGGSSSGGNRDCDRDRVRYRCRYRYRCRNNYCLQRPLSTKQLKVVLLLLVGLVSFSSIMVSGQRQQQQEEQEQTYYEILQIPSNASLKDIKKSYRTLALECHPDRNIGNEEEATKKFRQVNEAYEILSDPEQRKQYDDELKWGRPTTTATGPGSTWGHPHHYHPHHHPHFRTRATRDPFAQFNDLFHNDPFFKDAFREMDDLFAKTFQENEQQQQQQQQQQKQEEEEEENKVWGGGNKSNSNNNVSWGQWLLTKLLNACGIDFHFSSTVHRGDGHHSTTSYSSTTTRRNGGSMLNHHAGKNRYGNNGYYSTSTYTSKSTQTIIENGQKVTIQSLERDGNKIEEKYINEKLVQRKINGQLDQTIPQIAKDDL